MKLGSDWRAGYAEMCTSGSEGGSRKPTVAIQQGGGFLPNKTTCSIETGVALAKHYGRKTLLIDLDPQASATFYVMKQALWLLWKEKKRTTADLFDKDNTHFSIHNSIVQEVVPGVPGFDLLPSSPDLVDVDLRLADFVGLHILKNSLEAIQNDYEYIICDCPPNFNPVTKNSLHASNAYVIPTVPDFLSTYGIGLLQRSVKKLFAPLPGNRAVPSPVLGGIILTRAKTGVNLHAEYGETVRHDYPGQVFRQVISDSIVMAQAADSHMPVSARTFPKGMEETLQAQYRALAGEFISRIRHIGGAARQAAY